MFFVVVFPRVLPSALAKGKEDERAPPESLPIAPGEQEEGEEWEEGKRLLLQVPPRKRPYHVVHIPHPSSATTTESVIPAVAAPGYSQEAVLGRVTTPSLLRRTFLRTRFAASLSTAQVPEAGATSSSFHPVSDNYATPPQYTRTQTSLISASPFTPPDFAPLVTSILCEHGLYALSSWHESEASGSVTVMFTCAYPPDAELVLRRLMDAGLGRGMGGSVTVLPVEVARPSAQDIEVERRGSVPSMVSAVTVAAAEDGQGLGGNREGTSSGTSTLSHSQKSLTREEQRQLLFNTFKSTLAIERILEKTKTEARLGFDYLVMVSMAAIIAAIGLMENNVVVIVASMLISPLMGPIMAWSFGTVIHDWHLCKLGIRAEAVGIVATVGIGFLCGLVGSIWGPAKRWPTDEMAARGTLENALIGIAIGLPSGVGVALSVLSNSVGALVGVAISASLLPPAVNSGLTLAYALVGPLYHDRSLLPSVSSTLLLSFYSTLVTLLNIICIYLAAISMFRLKEVAPIPGKSDFWSDHIPNTRRVVDTVAGKEGEDLLKKAVRALRTEGGIEGMERMVTEGGPSNNPGTAVLSSVADDAAAPITANVTTNGEARRLASLRNSTLSLSGHRSQYHTNTGRPVSSSLFDQLLATTAPSSSSSSTSSSSSNKTSLEDLFVKPPTPTTATPTAAAGHSKSLSSPTTSAAGRQVPSVCILSPT